MQMVGSGRKTVAHVLPWEGRCGSQRVLVRSLKADYMQPRFPVNSPLQCYVFAVSVILYLVSYRLGIFSQNIFLSYLLSFVLSLFFCLVYLKCENFSN